MTLSGVGLVFVAPPLWLALAVALGISLTALHLHWLTRGGAIAAFLLGSSVLYLGGGKFAVPLLVFFVTSSVASQIPTSRRGGAAAAPFCRSARQVVANGGVAAIVVLAFRLRAPHVPWQQSHTLLMLYLAALATTNADTWASEIGPLSRRLPRLVSNWRPVQHGVSGAVSGVGLLAALGGSLAIAIAGWTIWPMDASDALAVCWAGFLGALLDSILGASIQARHRDPATGELTESLEVAPRTLEHVGGLSFVDNDVVNFIATAGGAFCAWVMLHFAGSAF